MSDTTLSIDYDDLRREVGRLLGFDKHPSTLIDHELEKVDDAIRSGLRSFYYPHVLKGQEAPHRWSFLRPKATISLVDADYAYDLPGDFGQVIEDVTFQVGDDEQPLAVIGEGELRRLQSQASASGTPRYLAWRQKTFDATTGQRFEAVVYPTPSESATLEYRYVVAPGSLSVTNRFPYGGAVHAETIRAACMAAAERAHDDVESFWTAEFERRLAASVQMDLLAQQAEAKSYATAAVVYGSYDWLAQEIGEKLGMGPNPKAWGHPQAQKVSSLIQRGVSEFYHAEFEGTSVRWHFLRPLTTLVTTAPYSTGTVTIAAGVVTLSGGTFPAWAADGEIDVDGVAYTVASRDTGTQLTLDDTSVAADAGTAYTLRQSAYELPAGFGGMDGPLTWQPGEVAAEIPIEIVPEFRIRAMRSASYDTDRPRYAAVQVRTPVAANGTRWELQFWPVPDAAYVFTYKYRANQTPPVSGEYPLGGTRHAETILECCLQLEMPDRRPLYLEKLRASVRADRAEFNAHSLGFNYDRSDGPGARDEWDRFSGYVPFDGVFYD